MSIGIVYAVTMVKDEADVVCDTIRHMVRQGIDGVVIADNGSTDGTRDLLEDLVRSGAPVTVIDDPEVGYYQSAKMSRLADMANIDLGAEWIVPFDADELWWTPDVKLGMLLRSVARDVRVAEARLTNYFPTDEDPDAESPFQRIVHRQPEPQRLLKVAVRWQPGSTIHQGNHGVTVPHEGRRETLLQVSHFPYRSEAQFVRKAINGAAAYKAAADLPADAGAHWRGYGEAYERGGEEALLGIYNRWFHFAHPADADPPLVRDPAPFAGA